MSKPNKAYILKIDNPISHSYAKVCADSCESVGVSWEYHMGYQNMLGKDAWALTGLIKDWTIDTTPYHIQYPHAAAKAECCSAGHAKIWEKIANGPDESAIVLEHDAIMLHPIDIDIPDDRIVVLGYKMPDPSKYDHIAAGPPKEFIDINGHEGAHAYAMTKKTAQTLIAEIREKGRLGCVDNAYFIRGQRRTKTPLCIASPTPAIGWLRESTIWGGSAYRNYQFIPSFQQNYK